LKPFLDNRNALGLAFMLPARRARDDASGDGRRLDTGDWPGRAHAFVLPFELLAVLMLAGLLGAIYFARRRSRW